MWYGERSRRWPSPGLLGMIPLQRAAPRSGTLHARGSLVEGITYSGSTMIHSSAWIKNGFSRRALPHGSYSKCFHRVHCASIHKRNPDAVYLPKRFFALSQYYPKDVTNMGVGAPKKARRDPLLLGIGEHLIRISRWPCIASGAAVQKNRRWRMSVELQGRDDWIMKPGGPSQDVSKNIE